MEPICNIDCIYGKEGHCGRSHNEFLYHCELLLHQGKSQRGHNISEQYGSLKNYGENGIGLVIKS
jgi:hypothetical protein